MRNFEYDNKTKIVFGKGVEEQVGTLTKAYGNKVLLHYGGGSIKKSGLYDRVIKALEAADVAYVTLGGVQPNPRLSLVQTGIDLCRNEGVDFILAVGGGSVIDSAKAIALGVHYEGDVWDFYMGKGQIAPEKIVKNGVILTIPAAGSETSESTVITNEEGWYKKGYNNLHIRPTFCLLNPELTFTLPDYQTACGVSDMLAHVMERYFTHEPHVELSDRLCEATMKTIIKEGPKLLDNPNNYDARADIMWAGTIAHNGLLGLGRIEDWASHNIEHEISGIYDVAHGAGLSIIFPAWMKYVHHLNINRFAQFASRVLDIEYRFDDPKRTVHEGIAALEAFYIKMGLPIRLSQIEVDASRINEMALKATDGGKNKFGSFMALGHEDIEAIYRLAL